MLGTAAGHSTNHLQWFSMQVPIDNLIEYYMSPPTDKTYPGLGVPISEALGKASAQFD